MSCETFTGARPTDLWEPGRISPLWIPSPLMSLLRISSSWGHCPGHNLHPQSLYRSHTPFRFLLYAYQIALFPFIHQTSCTLCFLSSLSKPHDSFNLFFFVFCILLVFCAQLAHDISLGVAFAPLRLSFTPVFVLYKFTASFYRWVFNIFY